MTFEHSIRTKVSLLAKFGERREAQAAVAFLAEDGIPTRVLPVGQPAASSPDPTSRGLWTPLSQAAIGAFLLGVGVNLVWLLFFPDALNAGWRLSLMMLTSAIAATAIAVVTDSVREEETPPTGDTGVVIALRVDDGQADYAADVLHKLGAARVVMLDASITPAVPRVIRRDTRVRRG